MQLNAIHFQCNQKYYLIYIILILFLLYIIPYYSFNVFLALEQNISSTRHKNFSFSKPKKKYLFVRTSLASDIKKYFFLHHTLHYWCSLCFLSLYESRERQLLLRYFQNATHCCKEEKEEDSFQTQQTVYFIYVRLHIEREFLLIPFVVHSVKL